VVYLLAVVKMWMHLWVIIWSMIGSIRWAAKCLGPACGTDPCGETNPPAPGDAKEGNVDEYT